MNEQKDCIKLVDLLWVATLRNTRNVGKKTFGPLSNICMDSKFLMVYVKAEAVTETANVALWDQILTEGGQIWGVATDDFHCAYITPGHGWVMVQIPEDSPTPVSWQTIVTQLKKGRSIQVLTLLLKKLICKTKIPQINIYVS